jgi:hypothetical protein
MIEVGERYFSSIRVIFLLVSGFRDKGTLVKMVVYQTASEFVKGEKEASQDS